MGPAHGLPGVAEPEELEVVSTKWRVVRVGKNRTHIVILVNQSDGHRV